jgi:hypothetical protein
MPKKLIALPPTHSAGKHNTLYDILLFFLLMLLCKIVPVFLIYITGLACNANKLAQKQLEWERDAPIFGYDTGYGIISDQLFATYSMRQNFISGTILGEK